jgi:hypothetical protein
MPLPIVAQPRDVYIDIAIRIDLDIGINLEIGTGDHDDVRIVAAPPASLPIAGLFDQWGCGSRV